jgi:hypothetical protein
MYPAIPTLPGMMDRGLEARKLQHTITGMNETDRVSPRADVHSARQEPVDPVEEKFEELYEATMQDESNMQIVLSRRQAGVHVGNQNNQEGRTWLYGANSKMNRDVDQFDL